MIVRYLAPLALAVIVTFGVFFLMQSLVMGSRSGERREVSAVAVDFTRNTTESRTRTKSRTLPEKVPPRRPSAPAALEVATVRRPSVASVPKMVPTMVGGMQLAGGFEVGAPASDTEALPLVRIEPRYPSVARARGIEGWVTVLFNVDTTGGVEDSRVKSAQPRGVFDTAALRAVEKWKYRPKIVDGRPVPRRDIEVTLKFEIEE